MLIQIILTAFLVDSIWTACPVEDDPANLARCIQIDTAAFVALAKGSNDMTGFCALADRYMECIKTYTRGCIGFFFGEGFLTELQNIALYCCNGIESTRDCPFNPNVQRRCIDGDANVLLSDGITKKRILELEIGDRVKTVDQYGRLIDTDVIMIMDSSDQPATFLQIKTDSNQQLKVSASHLVAQHSGTSFTQAQNLTRGDTLTIWDQASNKLVDDRIRSIMVGRVRSYSAPLTWHGSLLVNGVLTSSYAHVSSQRWAHFAMAPVRFWWYLFNKHGDIGLGIRKQINGTHWFPGWLEHLVGNYFPSLSILN